ncbi:MAG TPA: sugar porter family MFS transporter [Cellvibrio sp.]|nr:sugar porter family MFS transporter [Cellvibrio sp.]
MTVLSKASINSDSLFVDAKPLFIWMVTAVAALGGLLFGFDTAIISGALPFLRQEFTLSPVMQGWLVSSILLGCGAGALVAGRLSDPFGRKKLLIICALFFAIAGLGTGLANSVYTLITFRMLGGIAIGIAAMVSPMYIAEISPSPIRGRLVTLYQLAIVCGILLAFVASFLLSSLGNSSWRWMFASQAIPALAFFCALFFVPESPRWLAMYDRFDEARSILESVGGREHADQEILQIKESLNAVNDTSWKLLLSKENFRIIVIGVTVAVFSQITGINSILYYAPIIFERTGSGVDTALLQTLGIGLTNFLFTLVAIWLIDKTGRKPLLLFGSIFMGVSLLILAACFHAEILAGPWIFLCLMSYIASFAATLGPITWVYLSEAFPNRIRAHAMAIATLALWLSNFIATFTFPMLLASIGDAATMLFNAILCGVFVIFIVFKVHETKGKTLEDIQQDMQVEN